MVAGIDTGGLGDEFRAITIDQPALGILLAMLAGQVLVILAWGYNRIARPLGGIKIIGQLDYAGDDLENDDIMLYFYENLEDNEGKQQAIST